MHPVWRKGIDTPIDGGLATPGRWSLKHPYWTGPRTGFVESYDDL